MSRPAAHVVDGDLHAFADNTLSVERRAAILAVLEADPAEGRRVADWCAQNEAVRRTLGKIAFEPVPAALSLAVTSKRPGEAVAATAAEKPAPVPRLIEPAIGPKAAAPPLPHERSLTRVLALVGIAGAAGLFAVASGRLGIPPGPPSTVPATRTDQNPFAAAASEPATTYALRAVEAHRTFVADGQHPVEIGAAQKPRLMQWLERRLGQPITVPDLQEAGFALLGGRLVSCTAGPCALLVFQNGGGERLGLMVAETAAGAAASAMRYRAARGIGVVTWSQNGALMSLSGPADAGRLSSLATLAAAGMQAGGKR